MSIIPRGGGGQGYWCFHETKRFQNKHSLCNYTMVGKNWSREGKRRGGRKTNGGEGADMKDIKMDNGE